MANRFGKLWKIADAFKASGDSGLVGEWEDIISRISDHETTAEETTMYGHSEEPVTEALTIPECRKIAKRHGYTLKLSKGTYTLVKD